MNQSRSAKPTSEKREPRLKLATMPKPQARPKGKRGHVAQRQRPSASGGNRRATVSTLGRRAAPKIPLGDVRGVSPLPNGTPSDKGTQPEFTWVVEIPAGKNYRLLGIALAAKGNIYRNEAEEYGLIRITPKGKIKYIRNGPQLAPFLADVLPMQVLKDGKVVRELPTAAHLTAMLHSEHGGSEWPETKR